MAALYDHEGGFDEKPSEDPYEISLSRDVPGLAFDVKGYRFRHFHLGNFPTLQPSPGLGS
jgi:hypothetical protein